MAMQFEYLERLQWRYATKKFAPSKRVSRDEVHTLAEVLRLSPSSFGLQPWKFVFVSDPEVRATLRAHSYDQSQITDASFIIVMCTRTDIDEHYVDRYMSRIAELRSVSVESLAFHRQTIAGVIDGFTPQERTVWAHKQVYIALGFLLSACAYMHIDACPMEGFEKEAYDKILDLHAQHLASSVVCAVGHRDYTDPHLKLPKVRFDMNEIVEMR